MIERAGQTPFLWTTTQSRSTHCATREWMAFHTQKPTPETTYHWRELSSFLEERGAHCIVAEDENEFTIYENGGFVKQT